MTTIARPTSFVSLAKSAIARLGLYDTALRLRLLGERRLSIGQYRGELDFYRELIRPGDLCFDIGANLGQKTWLFLDAGAKVIAVEPQPSCLDVLHRSFGKRRDVEIVPAALASEEGQAELFLCDATSTISTMSRRFKSDGRFSSSFSWKQTIVVPTTTLDALVRRFGVPAYCKIDVEGYELSVLAGLSRPLPLISFEFSRELMDVARDCIARLERLGPTTFDCVLNRSSTRLIGAWASSAILLDRLAAIDSPLLVGEIYAHSPA